MERQKYNFFAELCMNIVFDTAVITTKTTLKNLKFYLLCILTGAVTGMVTVPYRYLLVKSATLREFLFAHDVPVWRHLFSLAVMWLAGMFIYRIVKRFPMISGSGIPQAEGAVNGRFSLKRPFKSLLAKFSGGLLGIGMGLSLGREGPSVQMGAYIAKLIGKWSRTGTAYQKYLITGGASAGLSSAFTAPLASTIFIIEEVEKFDSAKIAISSLLGGITSGWIAKEWITGNAYALIDTSFPERLEFVSSIPVLVGFALLLSLIGKSFNWLTLKMQSGWINSRIHPAAKILALVTVTYIIGYFFSDLVAGGENFLLNQALSVETGIVFLGGIIVLKLLFTPFCYSAGFPGGIFLPLLVIGGLTGKWYTLLLARWDIIDIHDFGFFMVIGMSALFAAVVRSPITGLVLILEMTGKFSIFFPMIVVVGLTYFISEVLGVKPIYDSLYERLLPSDIRSSRERITVPYEVGENSYLEGKRLTDIGLPRHCQITSIVRKGKPMPLKETELLAGDSIEIELFSKDLETLYRSFRSLTNE